MTYIIHWTVAVKLVNDSYQGSTLLQLILKQNEVNMFEWKQMPT